MRIECRNCNSPKCDGCNIYTLATMLHKGKLDCLMDEHRSIVISPEILRPKGKWELVECNVDCDVIAVRCSVCKMKRFGTSNFCPNFGADMRGDNYAQSN